jgi:hypothetical protein
MEQKQKTGRPAGSKTADREVVTSVLSRCRACDSTERTHYKEKNRVEGYGLAPDGKPYTAVNLRPTKCQTCGQCRIDREYEYVPETANPN